MDALFNLKFCSFILHDTALLFIQDTLFPLQHTFPTTQNITHTFLLQGIFLLHTVLTIQEPILSIKLARPMDERSVMCLLPFEIF